MYAPLQGPRFESTWVQTIPRDHQIESFPLNYPSYTCGKLLTKSLWSLRLVEMTPIKNIVMIFNATKQQEFISVSFKVSSRNIEKSVILPEIFSFEHFFQFFSFYGQKTQPNWNKPYNTLLYINQKAKTYAKFNHSKSISFWIKIPEIEVNNLPISNYK